MRSAEYENYLKSEAWQDKRRMLLRGYTAECWCCSAPPRPGKPLDLHHLTYARLGRELPEDLVPVCRRCHDLIHTYLRHCGSIRQATHKAREIAALVDRNRLAPTTARLPVLPPHQRPTPSRHKPSRAIHPGARPGEPRKVPAQPIAASTITAKQREKQREKAARYQKRLSSGGFGRFPKVVTAH